MLHRLTRYQGLDACDLTLTHNIQLARCKFYTVGTFHTAMVMILYWYAPVRSKRPVRREVAFTQGYRNKPSEQFQNRFKIRVVWKSEPEIGPFDKHTIPFQYEQERQVCSGPLSGTCWVSMGTRKCISLTISRYSRETLFPAGVFFLFLETSFQILISVNP